MYGLLAPGSRFTRPLRCCLAATVGGLLLGLAASALRADPSAGSKPRAIQPEPGNVGGLVDSIFKGQPLKFPQKHFVSPKNTLPGPVSYYLAFKSVLPDRFAKLCEWVPDPAGRTVLPASGDASQDIQVSRTKADHITIQVRLKGTNTVLDTMNVWIVWGTGQVVVAPKIGETVYPETEFLHAREGMLANDGHPGGGVQFPLNQNYRCKFIMQPPSMFSLTEDIPDLRGKKSKDGDTQIDGHDVVHGYSLATGAKYRWDITRRLAIEFLNPNLIPYAKLPGGYYSLYNGIGGLSQFKIR